MIDFCDVLYNFEKFCNSWVFLEQEIVYVIFVFECDILNVEGVFLIIFIIK